MNKTPQKTRRAVKSKRRSKTREVVSLSELYKLLSKYTARRAPAAITGGGGKTSLLYGLGAELEKLGRVLLTTTTKIFRPTPEECRDIFI